MSDVAPDEELKKLDMLSQSAAIGQNPQLTCNIYSQNPETLDEFCAVVPDLDLPKFQYLKRNFEKGKYTAQLGSDSKTLVVETKLFNPFTLLKVEKKQGEMLKDLQREVDKLNSELKLETCLFDYYFFTLWAEDKRQAIPRTLGLNCFRDLV